MMIALTALATVAVPLLLGAPSSTISRDQNVLAFPTQRVLRLGDSILWHPPLAEFRTVFTVTCYAMGLEV
jgi:hypothetical protein